MLQGPGVLHRLPENLIPGWRFDADEWVTRDGLRPDQVPHVKLFLFLYWVMTGLARPARHDRHRAPCW